MVDPAHGGISDSLLDADARAVAEVERFDFRLEKLLGDDYPKRSHSLVTDWYYYVFSKTENPKSDPCA